MLTRRLIPIFGVFFMAAAYANDLPFVTQKDLVGTLKSENFDKIVKSLNDIKFMSYKGKILPFLEDLWFQREHGVNENLPWDIINSDIVRINIADIIMQSAKNRETKVSTSGIYSFALQSSNSDDPDVAITAIQVLSHFDNDKAAKAISSIAHRRDSSTYRMAVLSLAKICNPLGAEFLAILKRTETDSYNLEFIKQQESIWAAAKKSYCR